ncbi:MAG: cell division protein FtsQ/DivIB [Fimbriimonadales bacterium]
MPKRRRRRTRIKWGPILVLSLIAVVVSGLFYSPLTSLTTATVTGANAADQANIEGILSTLNGIPWVMVNQRWVETRVQRIEAVDHASYSQNIFGRGHLEIAYREPVARVRGSRAIGLDRTGIMFETGDLPANLPILIRPDDAKDLPMTIAAGFPSTNVAELAVRARQIDPQNQLVIWFNKEGALCLNIGTGLVILGSCDELDRKLQSLKEILDDQPGLLAKLESLNLTEPSHPAKTYKRQRQ